MTLPFTGTFTDLTDVGLINEPGRYWINPAHVILIGPPFKTPRGVGGSQVKLPVETVTARVVTLVNGKSVCAVEGPETERLLCLLGIVP